MVSNLKHLLQTHGSQLCILPLSAKTGTIAYWREEKVISTFIYLTHNEENSGTFTLNAVPADIKHCLTC